MTFERKMPIPSTLTAALTADHQHAFAALLDHFTATGASIDHLPGFEGLPLLHFAVLHKKTWAVEVLLSRSADPNLKSAMGRTALDIALDPASPAPQEIAEMIYAHNGDATGSQRAEIKAIQRQMKGRFTLKGNTP